MVAFGSTRLPRLFLGIAFTAAIAACSSGTNNGGAMPAAHRAMPGARAAVQLPIARRASAGSRSTLRSHASPPLADEALQIGVAYPNRESWQIDSSNPVDPSCGMLDWAYTNAIPGVTVTLNPTTTSLTGSTSVSFTTIPVGTAVNVWSQTITPTCTDPSATGTLPTATTYTIATVVLDIAQVPQVPAAPTAITNTTATPVVGQFIELQASPQPAVTFVKVKWEAIPGDTVKTYTQTKEKAEFTMLGGSDLSKPAIDFFWIHGSAGTPGALKVAAVFPVFNSHCTHACTGKEDYWGQTNAAAMANVLAPTAVEITSKTGEIWFGRDPSFDCHLALHFGYPNIVSDCPKHGALPGTTWTMKATAPSGGAGELDGTQLIDVADSIDPVPSASPIPTAYPGTTGFALDGCIHYGNYNNRHEPIAAGAPATYTQEDTPTLAMMRSWKTLTATEKFTLSFVYKPADQAGAPAGRTNIWVPLGHLPWNWSGTGEVSNGRARLTASAHPTDPPGVVGNDPLPTWTSAYKPAPAEACPPGG